MKLYGLKNCDTCRKALKALGAAGKPVVFVDIRGDEVSAQDIARWEKTLGWKALLNTRSTTWRGLPDAAKADPDRESALALMAEHRALVKRPVIETGDDIYLGWKADVQKALL